MKGHWLVNLVITWFSRATGIGYPDHPPIIGGVVDLDYPYRLQRQNDKLIREVEGLERELRRRGHLPRD